MFFGWYDFWNFGFLSWRFPGTDPYRKVMNRLRRTKRKVVKELPIKMKSTAVASKRWRDIRRFVPRNPSIENIIVAEAHQEKPPGVFNDKQ